MESQIKIREADLGPVIARADHQENIVEVNSEIFYKLPPSVQEFVLCHEVCHLKHNEWDENRTNQLASELYLKRAKDEADRAERQNFLAYLGANGGYSNFAWSALIGAVVTLGTTVYGIIKNQNAMWYSWDDTSKQSNLNTMLKTAFEESRRTNKKSAADFFWAQMQNYTNKDDSLEQFLGRSTNAWVSEYISRYEQSYGFGFQEITPIDITAYPVVIIAIGAVVGYIVYKIIQKRKK